MLLNNQETYTPLEFTLLTWAAFAGDMLGNNPGDGVEAYIRRIIADSPEAREPLERLGATFLTRQSPALRRKDIGAEFSDAVPTESEDTEADPEIAAQVEHGTQPGVKRNLSRLVSSGLLVTRKNGLLSFQHPVLLAFLGGPGLLKSGAAEIAAKDLGWETGVIALTYMARLANITSLAGDLLQKSRDPLQDDLFLLVDGMRSVPKGQPWRTTALRRLAQIAQTDSTPFILRHRAVLSLVTAGEPDVARLFRPLLGADDHSTRQLASLACGYIRDTEAVRPLTERLYDTSPGVRRAACLALVNIGSEESLEQVATALLHGDDDLRTAAAEAFANNQEEGFPLLKDGVTLDDLLVRRATVFGLYRIGEPWARDLLGKLQLEDEQWVVRAAATQAVEELDKKRSAAPKPKPALHDTPWLIEFASARGMGVTTGKPAQDMLKLALKEGSPAQKIAALYRLSEAIDNESLDQTYRLFYTDERDVQDAAYLALWDLSRGGFDLPEPMGEYS
jgi:hypothetical protein